MRRDEPPDWALPAWDAVPSETAPRATPAPRTPTPAPRTPAPAPRTPAPAPPGTFGLRILTVSEASRAIRDDLRADERLRDLWVEGEIGRVTISSAGHAYFALKDERAQLQCVWFRDERMASPFEAQSGLRVVAHGRIDVFEPQGALQLYVMALQPAGFGDLALRFETLKARLAAEGLFDAARKRRLPPRPAVVAVATSPTGAVWHDIRTVLARRWPLVRVVHAPCAVQGDAAPQSIVGALRRIERWIERCRAEGRLEDAPAITILARGGGSLEDLWPFNDERVVRAVVAHAIPVVAGVGHETDVTLVDFAADVRAPTPSAAAELAVPDRLEALELLVAGGRRLAGAAERSIAAAARGLAEERRALDRLNPTAQIASARERTGILLDRATAALTTGIERRRHRLDRGVRALPGLVGGRLASARAGLDASAAALAVLAPYATLERGYAIVRRAADGTIVRAPAEAAPGTGLAIRVARGEIAATTTDG